MDKLYIVMYLTEDETNSEKKKKVAEEKRQREHILQLNQILAKQVMEKSKMVAGTKNWKVEKKKSPNRVCYILEFYSLCMTINVSVF